MPDPRIPLLDPDSLEGHLGTLNITRTVGQNPALLKAWGTFATYILGPELSLAPRQRELAILRVGWNHQAGYEWGHHVAIARSIGMTDADILAVQQGPAPGHLDELECLVLQAADDVKAHAEISGETWQRLQGSLFRPADARPYFYDRAVHHGVHCTQEYRGAVGRGFHRSARLITTPSQRVSPYRGCAGR